MWVRTSSDSLGPFLNKILWPGCKSTVLSRSPSFTGSTTSRNATISRSRKGNAWNAKLDSYRSKAALMSCGDTCSKGQCSDQRTQHKENLGLKSFLKKLPIVNRADPRWNNNLSGLSVLYGPMAQEELLEAFITSLCLLDSGHWFNWTLYSTKNYKTSLVCICIQCRLHEWDW